MTKAVVQVTSEPPIEFGGRKWVVLSQVTLPTLSHDHRRNPMIAVEFLSGFTTEDVMSDQGEVRQITSARVIDLQSNRECRYILNKMSVRALVQFVGGDDSKLIGRKFVLEKLPPLSGKRWCQTNIYEIGE